MGRSAAGSPNALTTGPMPGGAPSGPGKGAGGGGGAPTVPVTSSGYPAPAQAAATPGYAPLPQPSGFNVNQAAASGLQQAMQGTQAAMGYQPMAVRPTDYTAAQAGSQGYDAALAQSQGYNAARAAQQAALTADQVSAGQIAGTDLGAYTNPYESQVVQQSLGDLERSRLMQQNQLGAQASASGAFGGSRQGIAEAETNRAFADQAARTASGLRQSGYQQAQQLAGQDIATQMQAALANQGANLQAGTTTAQLAQQINLANQSAINQAGQFGAAAANQAALANQSALNQARQFGAAAANQAALTNQAASNQQRQFGATQGMTAQQLNQGAGLQGAQFRLGAAGQMGNLGQQAFNTSQAIQQQQMQQGLMQQGLQQQLIDAARGQYAGAIGAPQQSLGLPLAALGAAPAPQSTTNTMKPGLFNYLQLGANALCWVAREVYGEDDPKWLQFREWVIGYSPNWFYKAYSKYGENVAKVVAKVPALKLVIRPFMDAKRKAMGYK